MRNFSKSNLSPVYLPLLAAALFAATTPPDFSGKWLLDSSRSKDTNGETIQLTIEEPAGKIIYDRTLRDKNGKAVHMSFTCANLGKPCDMEENGHKGTVSLWYDGTALMIAKSGGENKNAFTERKLELSPDGKTLTVQFTNYLGTGKPQKLIFTKQ